MYFYPSLMELISALNWRYATKEFDPSKKISDENFNILLESLRLSASSFGLQPWKFLIVKNPEIREQLKPHSWGQGQITDASHLLVLCRQNNIDEAFVDSYIEDIANTRNVSTDDLEDYRKMMIDMVVKGQSETETQQWSKNQVYLALGNLLTSAALLKIDTCPIEGFSTEEYDKILNLSEKNLSSCVVCALGYRNEDDKYASLKKVRFGMDEVVETI